MQCETCGAKITSVRVTRAYSPNLPSVIVDGLEQATCPNCGDAGIVHPRPLELSGLVIGALINKRGRLAADEVTFLRGAIGLKGKDLAEVLGVTGAQVSRWETGRMPISALADRLLRMLVAAKHELPAPELRGIEARHSEPVSMRIELGKKGWRVVDKAKAAT